jgi:hypothetical protein
MTYQEAKKEKQKYRDIIGQFIDEDEISDVFIVPSSRKFDTEIIHRMYRNKPIQDIMIQSNDFTLIAVCMEGFSTTGVIYKYDIKGIREQIKK